MSLRTKHFYASAKMDMHIAQIEAHSKLEAWLDDNPTREIVSHSVSAVRGSIHQPVEYLISVIYK
jgi:hypothetical protein